MPMLTPVLPRLSAFWLSLTFLTTGSIGHEALSATVGAVPQPVSPGSGEIGALIAEPCPTFSWGAVDGAQRYELSLYDAQWNPSTNAQEQRASAEPVRKIAIDAPATSWTATGAQCLDDGASYVWFVRAETAEGLGPWSQGARLEVDFGGDALSRVVRRELALQLRQPEVWRDLIEQTLAVAPELRPRPIVANGRTTTAADQASASEQAAGRQQVKVDSNLPGSATPTTRATSFPHPAAFKTSGPGGVVFGGEVGDGEIPAEGSGARFMWYPGLGALRAGFVQGDQWDEGNIGAYSIAMGLNSLASGSAAVAIGATTAASGSYATAMGANTLAQSSYETVIGRYNTRYTPNSIVGWNEDDALFVVGNGTSDSTRSNALVLRKNGNLGLGINPQYQLHLSADSAAKPGTTTWQTTSDLRLKDIGGPFEPGLEAIARLNPVRFHYKPGNPRGHDAQPEYVGFVAQEVQPVIPESISAGADGYLDFNMHAVNVALVNAVKELKAQHERQQAEIDALREENSRLSALQARLTDLESRLALMQPAHGGQADVALSSQDGLSGL